MTTLFQVNEAKGPDINDDLTELGVSFENIEKDYDDIHSIQKWWYYKKSHILTILYYILCVLSLGVLPVFCKWFPQIMLYMTHLRCKVDDCTSVLVVALVGGRKTVCKVKKFTYRGVMYRYFVYRKVNFLFVPGEHGNGLYSPAPFKKINFNLSATFSQIREKYIGLPSSKSNVSSAITPLSSSPSSPTVPLVEKHNAFIFEETDKSVIEKNKTKRILFGRNSTDVPVKNPFALFLDEVLHPFYFFQVFSILVWAFDSYFSYATIIFVTSLISALINLVETRRNMKKLREMSNFSCPVTQFDPKTFLQRKIRSEDLVPGMMIEITAGMTVPCDCMLVSGEVVLNESQLTGESTPVIKNSIPDQKMHYNIVEHQVFTLFAGTKVLKTQDTETRAIVIRTGFSTSKGGLVLSILYPKPSQFSFHTDSVKFVAAMFVIGIIFFLFSMVQMIRMHVSLGQVILRALDVCTISVPPALPIAMTMGIAFSLARLRKKNRIFCISPPRINVAGKIGMVCFDKTGTLTREGLDLLSIRPSIKGFFATEIEADKVKSINDNDAPELKNVKIAMSACHSLVKLEGQVVGDTMEVCMFQQTGHELLDDIHIPETLQPMPGGSLNQGQKDGSFDSDEFHVNTDPEEEQNSESSSTEEKPENTSINEPFINPQHVITIEIPEGEIEIRGENILCSILNPSNGDRYGIMKRYEFLSALQRMSTIVKVSQNNAEKPTYLAFAKGSPEIMAKKCNPKTLPKNYFDVLNNYVKNGFRLIAVGYKQFKDTPNLNKLEREHIESNLIFLGFLIFENKLKPDTKHVISKLNEANIKSVMITGDNPFTAASVGRHCGIVKAERVFLGKVKNPRPDKEKPKASSTTSTNTAQLSTSTSSSTDITDDAYQSASSQEFDPEIEWKDIDSDDTLDPLTLLPRSSDISGDYELAVTGETLEILLSNHNPEIGETNTLFERVLVKCKIFARTTPQQKMRIVEEFQRINYQVAFCGDGANDSCALKTAQVGLSLSESEASIAAPFTSLKPTIKSVSSLIREGRASLSTSFQLFKFIALYSFVQTISVALLYSLPSNLGDMQYLALDLFIIFPLFTFMGKTSPTVKLTKKQPLSALMSIPVFSSLIVFLMLSLFFQLVVWFDVKYEPWYKKFNPMSEDDYTVCIENTIIFLTCAMQTINCSVANSISKPFKKPIRTNTWYIFTVVILYVFFTYCILCPDYYTRWFMGLVYIPSILYRIRLLVYSAAHLICCYLFERIFIVEFGNLLKLRRKEKKYVQMEKEFQKQLSKENHDYKA